MAGHRRHLARPCFTSPFRDAGYDVADYLTIAPCYGTTQDMAVLVQEAKERGIRVLLDLVAGHTRPWTTRGSIQESDELRTPS